MIFCLEGTSEECCFFQCLSQFPLKVSLRTRSAFRLLGTQRALGNSQGTWALKRHSKGTQALKAFRHLSTYGTYALKVLWLLSTQSFRALTLLGTRGALFSRLKKLGETITL